MQRDNALAYRLRKMVFSVFPRMFLERLAGKVLRKDEMREEESAYLREFFSDDVRKLEKLIGQDLSAWKGSR
jgi:hypothetical protein